MYAVKVFYQTLTEGRERSVLLHILFK